MNYSKPKVVVKGLLGCALERPLPGLLGQLVDGPVHLRHVGYSQLTGQVKFT